MIDEVWRRGKPGWRAGEGEPELASKRDFSYRPVPESGNFPTHSDGAEIVG